MGDFDIGKWYMKRGKIFLYLLLLIAFFLLTKYVVGVDVKN